jgi:hypothetical protein
LEGFGVTESQVVNEWISQGKLEQRREDLLRLLERRFPGQIPEEVRRVLEHQDSMPILQDWFDEAAVAGSMDAFHTVLRR